jgi:hypothetical protein
VRAANFERFGPFLAKGGKTKVLGAAGKYRYVRKGFRWFGGIVLFILAAIVTLALLLLIPAVQTWLAQELGTRLSRELGAEVSIRRVSIDPFGPLLLEGVYIGDLNGDTLIHAGGLRVQGLRIRPKHNLVQASAVVLDEARFALATRAGDAHSNLTNLLARLASSDTTTTGPDWTVRVARVLVNELHFSFADANEIHLPFGVDFDHVDVHARVVGRQFFMQGDSISVHLEELSARDHSGFTLERLSGATTVQGTGIRIENMALRTPRSTIQGQLQFTTESWAAYEEFTQEVLMRLELDSSRLDFHDIAYFAPDLQGIELPIGIHGRIRGTVSELRGRSMAISFGNGSWFRGSADLSGLPDLPNTFMLIDVEELRTDPDDLAALPMPPFTSGARLEIPAEVRQLGEIRFSGNFTGFSRAFTAYGASRTELGELRTDLSYERDTLTNVFSISGRAATSSFRLGALLNTPALGPLAANIRIKGSGTTLPGMRVDLDGSFPSFTFGGRTITGIQARGRLERNRFDGELKVDDEHLMMSFKGLADMRGRWPQVDFNAQVQHADLRELGLTPAEEYSTLSMLVNVAGRLSPDSLLGRLEARQVSYCNERGEHDLGDIIIRSGRSQGRNVLELDSDLADATVTGLFLPTRLGEAVSNVVYSVFPALREEVQYQQEEQRFTFEVYAKHSAPALDLFMPGLVVDSGAVFTGSLDSRSFDLDLAATIPGVRYGTLRATGLEVLAEKTLDVLAFGIHSDRQSIGDSIWLAGTSVIGKAYQDEVQIDLGWDASSSGTNGELALMGEVRGLRSITLDLLPSKLHLGRGDWANPEAARLMIDSSTVRVDQLVLYNGVQKFALDGTLSRDPAQALGVLFENVELDNLAPFLSSPVLRGRVNGEARLFDLYAAPVISSDLRVDSVHVDGHLIGDVLFQAGWTEGQRAIALAGHVDRGGVKALDFNGQLILDEEKSLQVDLVMDRFDLRVIEPYLPEGLSSIQGLVSGKIDVGGKLADPQVNGEVELANAGLRIDYLNTLYVFDHRMKIAPDMFAFDLVTIRDEEGNTGRIGGTILHNGLADWNFHIWGRMDQLMVLNTTLKDNDLFYGKAYGSGEVSVSGYAGNMEIIVDARTAPGTDIHFPIGGSMEVSDIGFIRFLSPDTTHEEQAVDLAGITLDMKVEVTPEAHFELIFDPTVGDILSGRGRGNMEMSVSPTGNFAMRGQVEIADGDYLFTLRNVVNKRFQLEPGGRIVWYGDPFDAQLDLHANYRVRAPLYDIMYEKNDAYRRRVPIDVVMHLRDKLMNPEINFEVRLPSVDEAIRTQVNSVLSTEQELNRQVFALIVLNRFVPPPSYAGQGTPGGGNVAGTTTSELLSNQVSNWLSRLSNDFDLGVNYRPGDNITQDELEVAVSTQLFAERLLLSTNLGVAYGQQTTQNSNALIGDFLLEYLLTNDGKLRLKAFSQSNDRNLNRADQALTTQGAGVAYREEFNTFSEFWQRVRNIFRSSEKDHKFDQ